MKLLIIGDDIHANRYRDVLFFNSNIELDYNNYENINDYDVIIFSVPYMFNEEWYNKFKDYHNILIFEKCQFEIEKIKDIKAKTYIVHLRDFDENKVEFQKENNIIWPNLINDGMNIIKHTLPNILDLIRNNSNTFNPSFDSIYFENNSCYIKLTNDNKVFNVKIENNEAFGKKVELNNEELNWPDYFKCINKMMKKILNDEYDKSLEIDIKYKSIINEMEKKI